MSIADSAAAEAVSARMPPPVVTVAITGHRTIAAEHRVALEAQVGEVLDRVTAAFARQAPQPPQLRFVSALAEGADQIGTAAALARPGWRVAAILPFARAAYAATFDDEVAAAAMLRLAASEDLACLELADRRWTTAADAPAREALRRDRRYATVGRMLVLQADLLVAIWDGEPGRGVGGTADVVIEARRQGIPLVWLDPAAAGVRSIVPDPLAPPGDVGEDPSRNAHRGSEPAIAAALSSVLIDADPVRASAIERFVHRPDSTEWRGARDEPPVAGTHAFGYSLLLWWAQAGERKRAWPFRTLRPAGSGGHGLRARWRRVARWRRRFVVMLPSGFDAKLGGGAATREAIAAATGSDAPLAPFFVRADRAANRLGHVYRSGYLLIFGLAAVAVPLGALWLFSSTFKAVFTFLELAAVLCAMAVWVRLSPPRRWGFRGADVHQRWLDARGVAESLRGVQLLSWIGAAGRRPVTVPPHDPGPAHGHAPPVIWTAHFVNAVAALPALPDGAITPARIATLAHALDNVLADQQSYHLRNQVRLEKLHHWLDAFGFGAVVAAAAASALYLLAKLGAWAFAPPWLGEDGLKRLSVAAAFIGSTGPALAAASAGVRYHGDYERFAVRSRQTRLALVTLRERVAVLRARIPANGTARSGDAPLFEDLLELMLDAQAVLEDDLSDWRFAYAARPMPLP